MPHLEGEDNMRKPRCKTKKEAREEFLEKVRSYVETWSDMPLKTPKEICNGLALTILALLDGCDPDFPNCDIVLKPHRDSKRFHKSRGEDWFESGMVINDADEIHSAYYK
jgi:hypothetical protein